MAVNYFRDKYDIQYTFDADWWKNVKYTIDYEELLHSGYQLVPQYFVEDICRANGHLYTRIEIYQHYLDLKITEEQEHLLRNLVKPYFRGGEK